MIQIISHRGFWTNDEEKNTLEAFQKSFSNGFGIETDIRDLDGRIVISHDVPHSNSEPVFLKDLLSMAETFMENNKLTIALNIKSDGLVSLLNHEIENSNVKGLDIFVFDMSVPDMRDYFRDNYKVFSRVSEVELDPSWYQSCSGIWLDSFETNWFNSALIEKYISDEKKVCIVSSELHGREYTDLWDIIYPLRGEENIMLCTDLPTEAELFFNSK